MAADIFGAGDDRQVDTRRDRPEEERSRPGVVDQSDQPARFGCGADRRHVLHLERMRARALHEHRPGPFADQVRDPGADHRVVIGRRHAEALEEALAERTGRPVDAVDHQKLVAGLQHRQQRPSDRRRARWIEPSRRGAGLELGKGLLQRPARRRAVASVMERAVLGRVGRLHLRDAFEQHGRGAPHRRVDDSQSPFRAPAGLDEPGLRRLALHAAAPRALGVSGSAPHSDQLPS